MTLSRARGWKCDTKSAARPFVFPRGFGVSCNCYAYQYDIADRSGRWAVTLD